MSKALRRWQARIEIGEEYDWDLSLQTVFVYGETLDMLREAARMYLNKNKPAFFTNGGDHISGRVAYFIAGTIADYKLFESSSLEKGLWYRAKGTIGGHVPDFQGSLIKKHRGFGDAVDHFVKISLIPEKGPDYQSRAIIGSNIRLALLEKALREGEERPVNDLIHRGWHIIALEYKGELSMSGELMNRKAVFVMGHPDEQAAASTLDSEYYSKS